MAREYQSDDDDGQIPIKNQPIGYHSGSESDSSEDAKPHSQLPTPLLDANAVTSIRDSSFRRNSQPGYSYFEVQDIYDNTESTSRRAESNSVR